MLKSVKVLSFSLSLAVVCIGSVGLTCPVGDLNGDCKVDFDDLGVMATQWLYEDCSGPDCADLDDANGVDMVDFALLAKNWQSQEIHLVISEFMARNSTTEFDANGESSDWLEIYNPTDEDVNLQGWYLTDNDANLTKWRFPAVELKSGEFLLIFASGKDRLDPNELHTNFKLDGDGEYLALVAADGNTIVHEYAPEYPKQLTDISYGLMQYAEILVPVGATTYYYVPTDGTYETTWMQPNFNDLAEWQVGQTGLGFGFGGAPIRAYNDCVYRSSDQYIAPNVTTYGIGNRYTGPTSGPLIDQTTGDDTGVTVTLTQNGGVTWQVEPSSGGHDCAAGTDAYNTFGGIADMTGVIYYGSIGWWVDLTFTGLDPATEYTFATSAARCNYTGRFTIYTLSGADTYTNASTAGVDVLADNKVRFNTGDNFNEGYVARWSGITASDGSFTVRAESDPGSTDGRKAYSFDVFCLDGGMRVSDLQDAMLGINASLWSRIEFNVQNPTIFDTLKLRMKYEDGFIAYLNGQEVARRNAPSSVHWNSAADSNRPNEDALVFEVINLMPYMHLLQTGRNVLAIHGLNDNKDDGDFLILPELVAASNVSLPQYFTTPTPWTFNVPGAIDIVGEVWLSHKRGFHDDPFEVTLSCKTEDAEIRYTLDSSRPSATHGSVYSSPVPINGSTTLRAVAVKPGWLDSEVKTHSYIFISDVIEQATNPVTGAQVTPPGYPTSWGSVTGDYQMDPDVVGQDGQDLFGGLYAGSIEDDLQEVPTICMVMDKDDWFGGTGIYINKSQDGTERAASFEFIDPDSYEDFQLNCAIAMQGGVSGGGTSLNRWKVYKLSMRPRFKPQTDAGIPTGGPSKLNYRFFGDSPIERYDTVVLDAVLNNAWNHSSQHNTAIYIQDQCVADFHNAMGGHSPHGFYAHVYINELYWGMYYIHERPDHSWAAEMFGGDKDEYDAIKHDTGKVINNGGGLGSGTAAANFNAMVNAASAVQSDPTNLTKYNTLCNMLDVDNFITYILSHWYGINWDWPSKNWYATHRHPDGKWRFHTWDAEHSLEWYNYSANVFGASPYGVHAKLAASAEYKMRFADNAHKAFFNGGPLSYPASAHIVQARMNQVDRAIVGESARWGDRRSSIPHTRQDLFDNLSDVLSDFIAPRTTYLFTYLRSAGLYPEVGAPVFYVNGDYQHGGTASTGDSLSMTATTGTIYYTTDGTDPRLPGGAVNSSHAVVYTGPISLNASVHLKARTLSASTWSALNEAVYAVGSVADYLRVTEIMYHPKDTGNPHDPNKEFIELKNIGPVAINLNLVRFTNGIDFNFPSLQLPAGEYVVVVKDRSAFESEYGLGINIAGEFTGSLSNAGEQVRLADALGDTILDFRYNDVWRPITDGDGFSLTIIDAANADTGAWSGKDAWRSSAYAGGSPGEDDDGTLPNPGAIVINEVMSHSHLSPDWIELHNTTGAPIDIGGWYLSDSGRSDPCLMKYRIPDGTTIGVDGYIVFYEDANFANPGDPGCNAPFAMSENGEEIYLSSAEGTVLTGYREVEDFGAAESNVSFGRHFKSSTGNYNFVAMDSNTPKDENACPRVGPIVINEIMYNPPSGNQHEEYVELHNITSSPVTLYDSVEQLPWKFTNGIEYTFSSTSPVTIPANGFLLVVKNPTAFSLRHPAVSPEKILGPYDGWLSNAGERLQLSKPGDVDGFGNRYYIRIDRVRYSDGTHPQDCPGGVDLWSILPDGRGWSLNRRVAEDYGNDVANWQASMPSPGD